MLCRFDYKMDPINEITLLFYPVSNDRFGPSYENGGK